MSDEIVLEKRKEKVFNFFKQKTNFIYYIILSLIILIASFIRTRNLPFMEKYIPDIDSYIAWRYAEYILEHGKLFAIDPMRSSPLGQETAFLGNGLAYTLAYLHKFLHFFARNITLERTLVWYPVIFFALALIVFFLLIKKLFNNKVAIFSTAFLAFVPSFLHRTIAGVADKEPLGIFLMILVFYFYVAGWESKTIQKSLLFGALAGISTSLMGLSWGGVGFVSLIIPFFTLIELLMDKFTRLDLYEYIGWFIPFFITSTIFTTKYGGIRGFLISFSTSITLITLIFALVLIFIKKSTISKRIEQKIPISITSFLLTSLFLSIITIISFGFDFIKEQFLHLKFKLFAIGQTRWVLTVAENHQPFFTDWIGQFGWTYLLLFLIGSIILFYNLIKNIKDYKWHLTAIFILFLSGFIFSKYSSSSTLDGETFLSRSLLVISLLLFIGSTIYFYLYTFYRNKNMFTKFSEINKKYIFIFVWFFLTILAAKSAIRLIFVFSPTTALLAAYALVGIIDLNKILKEIWYKILVWAGVIVIIYLTIFSFAQNDYAVAKGFGLSYDQQWQNAMDWVRENTQKDAVFAHWWDYGYWVQQGGERATILDGGNTKVYWNFLMGRNVLTGHSSIEALEFLKAHNATHLLIVSDEIGKYPAYSSIGSDENYDRYSSIPLFALEESQIQETRNSTIYLYRGGFSIDQDFTYNGVLFPAYKAGIGGITLEISKSSSNENSVSLNQPIAILIYQGKRYDIPIQCVFFNNQERNFEKNGVNGCFRLIPQISSDGKANPIGTGFYLSEKVRKTLFAQMYLMDKEWDGFKKVYSDDQYIPLALYNGRLIGPTKIWEISYPSYIEFKPEYLQLEFPNPELEKPKRVG